MDKQAFINYLTEKNLFQLNEDGTEYLHPWEVKQTEELFEAFDKIGNALNSSSKVNGEIMMQAMVLATGHRTLEQNFVRMMLLIIETLAEKIENPEDTNQSSCRFTDPRNRSGRQICHELLQLFEEKKGQGAKPSQYLGNI